MAISISEREVQEALQALRNFLSRLAERSVDSGSAERCLRLLKRYELASINKNYCYSIGSDLTRGIGEWAWSDNSLATLEPLVDDLLNKVGRHLDLLEVAPNNSFKPSPLRGLGRAP